jgi:hypothetical protein
MWRVAMRLEVIYIGHETALEVFSRISADIFGAGAFPFYIYIKSSPIHITILHSPELWDQGSDLGGKFLSIRN